MPVGYPGMKKKKTDSRFGWKKIRIPFYGIGISTPDTNRGTLPPGFTAIATFRQGADWKAKPGSGMSPEEIFALRYRMLPE